MNFDELGSPALQCGQLYRPTLKYLTTQSSLLMTRFLRWAVPLSRLNFIGRPMDVEKDGAPPAPLLVNLLGGAYHEVPLNCDHRQERYWMLLMLCQDIDDNTLEAAATTPRHFLALAWSRAFLAVTSATPLSPFMMSILSLTTLSSAFSSSDSFQEMSSIRSRTLQVTL